MVAAAEPLRILGTIERCTLAVRIRDFTGQLFQLV